MPPILTGLIATTEIEAVNTMLAAIGEDPLDSGTDLSTATQPDVTMAVNTLRNTTREVLSMGWRFNTEFGFEVKSSDELDWTGSDDTTVPLNIYVPPAGLISFSVTKIDDQQGSKLVDTEIRPARIYSQGTIPEGLATTVVFYDRQHARDGFPVADRSFLYINPVWLFPFVQIPEVCRRYIVLKAVRAFVGNSVGSDTLVGFTRQDEAVALRNLKREQGEEDSYSFLSNIDTFSARGRRPSQPRGVSDLRVNRNFKP
jgi:Autographiviridae tail tubular protein Gp11